MQYKNGSNQPSSDSLNNYILVEVMAKITFSILVSPVWIVNDFKDLQLIENWVKIK